MTPTRAQDVLVVGGTGFIGAPLVRALAGAGHRVTVYHRGTHEPVLPAGVEHVRDAGAAIPVLHYPVALRTRAFDAVVLVVPLGETDARAAVDAFRGRAGRLVVVSSMDVYAAYAHVRGQESRPPGGRSARLLDEDAPARAALYPYGRVLPSPWGGELRDYEKLLAERTVLGATLGAADVLGGGPPGTVLRLPAVYGPGDRQRRLASWLARLDTARPVLLGARQAGWRWTHGYVDDVAAAVALAATHPRAARRVYNVGEAETPTVAERVRALGRAAGRDGAVVTVPDDALPQHLREPLDYAADLAFDTSRIRRELGYAEPTTPDEALRRTVAALRADGLAAALPDAAALAAEDAALDRTDAESSE